MINTLPINNGFDKSLVLKIVSKRARLSYTSREKNKSEQKIPAK